MPDFDLATLDFDKLTMAELEVLEEKTGKSLEQAFAGGAPKARALRAIAYILTLRENPDFTWEESGDLTINFADVDPEGKVPESDGGSSTDTPPSAGSTP